MRAGASSSGGPNVVGVISLPGGAEPAEPWNLEFERLEIRRAGRPQTRRRGATISMHGARSAQTCRPINFHAARVDLGRAAVRRGPGDARRSRTTACSLKQLTVTGSTFAAHAKGEWRGKDGGTGRIDGTITSTDVGEHPEAARLCRRDRGQDRAPGIRPELDRRAHGRGARRRPRDMCRCRSRRGKSSA